jgi:hypothetical protein
MTESHLLPPGLDLNNRLEPHSPQDAPNRKLMTSTFEPSNIAPESRKLN